MNVRNAKNVRVAWDSSHGEFLISDYYYFSKLRRYAEREGILVDEVKDFEKLWEYDVIVFNYPEIKFTKREVDRILRTLEKDKSKTVVLLAYYSNVDGVAENVNRVSEKAGIKVENGVVMDYERNAGDPMFPIAEWRGKEVLMPCSSPVRGGVPVVAGKDVFAAKSGNLVVFGTCVFWDNYSIGFKANRELALSVLKGKV